MTDFIPNSFQVPNAVVDQLMADLSGAELKCYLTIVRKTKGWRKEQDKISVSQFIKTTGLSNRAVINACKKLEELGLVSVSNGENRIKLFSVKSYQIEVSCSEESSQLEGADGLCKKFTSEKSSVVKKDHSGGEESSQQVVKKVHSGCEESSHTKDTQQKPLIKNTIQKTVNVRFDEFWDAYDKKVGSKPKLIKKWESLSDGDRLAVMAHVPDYVAATPDKKFRKNPETYLNNHAWNDEIIPTTGGNHGSPAGQHSGAEFQDALESTDWIDGFDKSPFDELEHPAADGAERQAGECIDQGNYGDFSQVAGAVCHESGCGQHAPGLAANAGGAGCDE